MKPKAAKIVLFSLVIFSIGVAVGLKLSTSIEPGSKPVAFRDFMGAVDYGDIARVTITGQKVSGLYRRSNERFYTYAPAEYRDLASDLSAKGISITH